MIVWKREGSRIVGYVRDRKAVELTPEQGEWRWRLVTPFLDEVLLLNPFVCTPPRREGRGDESSAMEDAAQAVAGLAA